MLYGLKTAWLNAAARRRLNGFHARCLRTISRIPHSYLSRVSNAVVLEKARCQPLSEELMRQQLLMLQKVAASGDGPLRDCVFVPGTLDTLELHCVKRLGRPRLSWAVEVRKLALAVAGSEEALQQLMRETARAPAWRRAVDKHMEGRRAG